MITIGKIGKPRGVNGEMYVTPMTDFPDRFVGLKEIYVDSRGSWEKMTVTSSKLVAGRPVIGLEQVKNPEDASRLTNLTLAVPRDQLVKLPENTYFEFDLIGAEVIDHAAGVTVGKLEEIQHYPANDVYIIRKLDGSELLCPAITEFVRQVDVAAKKIVIVTAGLAIN